MSIRFDDKIALVTGAGGGIGRCHALELAKRGAKVIVNDLGGSVEGSGGSLTAAGAVVEEIKAAGGEAVANGDSVSDPKGAQSMIDQAVDAFGGIDIVINNAGILRDKTFAKMTLDDFQAVIDVHLMGAVYVTKAAFPVMKERNYGRIVMTTSASGLYGNFGQSNYGAAKLGLVGLANTLKLEGDKFNIRANCIAPVALTRMTDGLMPEGTAEKLDPALVTPAVLYLCSQDAPTGHVLEAGAGYYSKVEIVEGQGVHLSGAVTPEDVAAHYAEISDMSGARSFTASFDAVAAVLEG
jgi:NAD(P)-dependent dehydrogenase (short-subunit alcohol dehydrogenase family)